MKQSLILILIFLITRTLNPLGDFHSIGLDGVSKIFSRMPKFKFLEFEL